MLKIGQEVWLDPMPVKVVGIRYNARNEVVYKLESLVEGKSVWVLDAKECDVTEEETDGQG